MTVPRARPPYLPALDGLRAVAVVLVLLHHGDVTWLPGGFLGVDLFFVLSGFLITRLLLAERAVDGTVDLRAFWVRRARRLLPALGLLLAGIAAYAQLVASPEQLASIRADAIATAGYVANWRFVAADEGYFAAFAAPSPLRHVWSLAVEEQWYVLWPLALPLVMRARRPLVVVATLVAASAAAMAFLATTAGTDRAYYGTDTRAQALLLGAALAIALARGVEVPDRARAAAGIVGTAVLAALVAFAHGESASMYRGGFLVAAVAATAVVLACSDAAHGNAVTSILDRAPLRALGRMSYGVYLWHWPLYLTLTPARTGLHGPLLLAGRIAATLAVAALSYRFVELPVQRAQSRSRVVRIAMVAPIGAAATVLALLLATVTPPSSIPSASALARIEPTPAPTTVPLPIAAPVIAKTRPVRVLVVGDSVAGSLARGYEQVGAEYGVEVVDRSEVGCGLADSGRRQRGTRWEPTPAHCANNDEQWAEKSRELRPDVTIVTVGLWDVQVTDTGDAVLEPGTDGSDAFLLGELRHGLDGLLAGGGRVVLLTAPYNAHGAAVGNVGEQWNEDRPARIDHFNGLLRQVARELPGVTVLDLNAFTAPAGEYTNSLGGVRLRDDGVHFTPAGGALVFHWLAPQLVPGRTPDPG